MIKRTCDRCGRAIQNDFKPDNPFVFRKKAYPEVIIWIIRDAMLETEKPDLCIDCSKALIKFVYGKDDK